MLASYVCGKIFLRQDKLCINMSDNLPGLFYWWRVDKEQLTGNLHVKGVFILHTCYGGIHFVSHNLSQESDAWDMWSIWHILNTFPFDVSIQWCYKSTYVEWMKRVENWVANATITATTHGRNGVSSHWRLEYLFNNLHWLTMKATNIRITCPLLPSWHENAFHITCPLCEESICAPVDFPHKGQVKWVFMSQRHHTINRSFFHVILRYWRLLWWPFPVKTVQGGSENVIDDKVHILTLCQHGPAHIQLLMTKIQKEHTVNGDS